MVLRPYSQFYTLEQKLKEVHGDFEGIELPSKRHFGTKNLDFLESKRAAFQTYLQVKKHLLNDSSKFCKLWTSMLFSVAATHTSEPALE